MMHIKTHYSTDHITCLSPPDCSSLLHMVSEDLAECFFQDGCSVMAACCHLAVDNIKVPLVNVCMCVLIQNQHLLFQSFFVLFQLAMSSLIRGNELELAACVGLVLGEAAQQSTAYCLELLARKYMSAATWYVASLLQDALVWRRKGALLKGGESSGTNKETTAFFFLKSTYIQGYPSKY